MLRLKKLAVAGSIASGKSSVSQIFEELGAAVISADKVVHHLLAHDSLLIKKLQTLLGNGVVKEGKIDRRAMATEIFKEADLRKQVEALIHPLVKEEMERALQAATAKGNSRLFVAEIPLFFESHLEDGFDLSIAVTAPIEIRLKRFIEKTGYGAEEFKRRESAQLSDEEKQRCADYVIRNSGTLQQLRSEVVHLYQQLTH